MRGLVAGHGPERRLGGGAAWKVPPRQALPRPDRLRSVQTPGGRGLACSMAVSLKYAVVERERRFLVSKVPGVADERRRIVDRYVTGTRLRLREVVTEDGAVTRKLGHKVRLGAGPHEIACTSLYLDDDEWDVLCALPATTLRKVRHLVTRGGVTVAIDELEDGTLLAEIDDQDGAPVAVPGWLDVLREVTDDEEWTGARLAR